MVVSDAIAAEVLDELAQIRASTRRRRHAFWLPLLVFGLGSLAAAPMYMHTYSIDVSTASYGQAPLVRLGWVQEMLGGYLPDQPAVVAVYWIGLLVIGTLITAAWYAWFAKFSGAATSVRFPVVTWVVAVVVVAAFPVIALFVTAPFDPVHDWVAANTWRITSLGTSGLVAVAAGLWALARVERSRLLTIVCVVFTCLSLLSVVAYFQNTAHEVLGVFGIPDSDMPFWIGDSLNVIVPGVVLLVGAVWAFIAEMRSR